MGDARGKGRVYTAQEVLNLILDVSGGLDNAAIKLPAPQGYEASPVDAYLFVPGGREGYFEDHQDPFVTGDSNVFPDGSHC